VTLPADFLLLARSFDRDLTAENKSPKTRDSYGDSIRQFGEYLDALDPAGTDAVPPSPERVAGLAKAHVVGFIAALQARTWHGKPLSESTVNNRFRGLQQWFKWLDAEGELTPNPMANLKPPKVSEIPVGLLSLDQQRAFVGTCGKGRNRTFRDIRDDALVRLMIDAGPRRAEMAGLKVDDVDLTLDIARVVGKGNKIRNIAFGPKTARALDRYLRARARHPKANQTDALWLGTRGALTGNGILHMVKRRGATIGIPNLHPHQLRHTFSHEFLAAGGSEADLMRLNGWTSRSMPLRYGAALASERAIDAHRRFSPGERL
jgi:site-specific recombinase XerD